MPIYEFKCLKCGEFIELLIMGQDDKDRELTCPKCNAQSFERVLSRTGVSIGSDAGQRVSSQTRNCSGGSCTTYEIPGHSR
jgi:putative FmdB family regulatory protein